MRVIQGASWKRWLAGLLALLCLALLLRWIVADAWSTQGISETHVQLESPLETLTDPAQEIQFTLPLENGVLQQMQIYPYTEGVTEGQLDVAIYQDEKRIWSGIYPLAGLWNGQALPLLSDPISLIGSTEPIIHFTASGVNEGGMVSLFIGKSTLVAGRYAMPISQGEQLLQGGSMVQGQLCYDLQAEKHLNTLHYYWPAVGFICLCYIAIYIYTTAKAHKGQMVWIARIASELKRYRFLVRQLVMRDFNTKYRQSVLGVLWSFLNPLLSTLVMYVVFGTLFRSDIPNYTVYLLSGITMFNFFTNATGLGLESITGNAALISKVYVPRYIYPLTRVTSSLIDLAIGMLPLLIACLVTGLRVTRAWLLLPFPLLCVALFALGMSFLLATSNVFFRDTKFLWGILTMLWTYLTPLFYSDSIIPVAFQRLYRVNPMYQFITFLRCIMINGVSPQPAAYLYCLLCCLVPLFIGYQVFRRLQNQFVIHL